ncbi:GNAT family N-acetyltransferase [Rhizobium sp. 18055]|uniref:GNAT family N-acetyltransferase n=1 Tax=Rhizobium sp. 18055 TaxID=2681403 RepID=UPI00135A07D4|nr:GNAT family N-acetyltransferase [Rhizobium sp. 18055]
MQPFIEIVAGEPDPGDKDQLLNILRGYNAQWTAHIADRPHLAILARSKEGGDVIGGLFASDEYNWLFIKYLVMQEEFRGMGLGSRLMRDAETIARERGYFGLFLDTFEFQAKPFYEKLGYEVFGSLEGNHETPARFFLKKRLAATQPD